MGIGNKMSGLSQLECHLPAEVRVKKCNDRDIFD